MDTKGLSFGSAGERRPEEIRDLTPYALADQVSASVKYTKETTGQMLNDLLMMSPKVQKIIQTYNNPERRGLFEDSKSMQLQGIKKIATGKNGTLVEDIAHYDTVAVPLEDGDFALVPRSSINFVPMYFGHTLNTLYGIDHKTIKSNNVKINQLQKPAIAKMVNGQLQLKERGSVTLHIK